MQFIQLYIKIILEFSVNEGKNLRLSVKLTFYLLNFMMVVVKTWYGNEQGRQRRFSIIKIEYQAKDTFLHVWFLLFKTERIN